MVVNLRGLFIVFLSAQMSEPVQPRKDFFPITESKCEKIVKHNSFLKAQTPSPSQIRFVTLREVKEIRNSIDAAV